MKKRVHSFLLVLAILFSMPELAPASAAEPAPAADQTEVVFLTTGYSQTFVIRADGTLWGWGNNNEGQIGDGTKGRDQDRYAPVQVGTDADWVWVASGTGHTIAIKENGTLWAWGNNYYGQLGDGTNIAKSLPTKVGVGTDWASVSAGSNFTVALKTDGSLWTWGCNTSGQLGIGSTAHQNVPARVGTANNWAKAAAGSDFVVAIKAEGSLWTWGSGNKGTLGDGNAPYSRMSPMQISADTDWADVAAGADHAFSIKTGGSLWAWGLNTDGQIGDGSSTQRNAPVRIGTSNDWESISAGLSHNAAVKTDGSIWTWGRNDQGQLGLASTTNQKSPVKMGTMTDWTNVFVSGFHTVALKTNGSLWGWGRPNLLGIGVSQVGLYQTIPTYIMGPPIPVTGVTLSKTTAEVQAGYSISLTASIEPDDATNKAITWQSSDESIAVVNERGKVTGVAMGEAVITAGAVDGGFTASCTVTVIKSSHGIDYDGVEAVIVPGSQEGFSIDLTKETITIPDSYTPVIYSIDGGVKWKPVKDALSESKFPKLFGKDMTLVLSDKPLDKTTKKPADGAAVVAFAKINKRAAAPKLTVNYRLGADPTGATPGDWVLTEKNGTKAVKDGLQIGILSGKKVDGNGYGQFCAGETNGIAVKALTGSKVEKTAYFIRTAPKKDGTIYIAASKPKKITVSGEQKAPKYKVKSKDEKRNRDGTVKTPSSKTLKLKKDDLIFAGAAEDIGAAPVSCNAATATLANGSVQRIAADKGAVVSVKDVSGTITIWKAATAKKPASAKQTIVWGQAIPLS